MYVFLVGRHGAGKSTVGQYLRSKGFSHYSVGTLRRLAERRLFPKDVPPALLLKMTIMERGGALGMDAARLLVAHVSSLQKAVVDGFPSTPEHLDLLPPGAVLAVVTCPPAMREERLLKRGESSPRRWEPGRQSGRDDRLPAVLRLARARHDVTLIRNGSDLSALHDAVDDLVARPSSA